MSTPAIGFRPLTGSDLPLMRRWLTTPHVQEWWGPPPANLDAVARKYGPRIRGEEPTHPYLILLDGRPIGYIQWYLWRDWPDYACHLDLTEESSSLDLFIGEAACLHRGLGPLILQAFLRQVVFAHPEVQSCIITPEVGNTAAHRAYARAGFRHWRTIDHPDEQAPVYLMRIGREELS